MAITQPTWTIEADALVSHIGAYTDTREAAHAADTTAVHGLSDTTRAVGSCVYSGGSYPSRPTGFASVMWIGPTDPGGSAVNGDTWVPTA